MGGAAHQRLLPDAHRDRHSPRSELADLLELSPEEIGGLQPEMGDGRLDPDHRGRGRRHGLRGYSADRDSFAERVDEELLGENGGGGAGAPRGRVHADAFGADHRIDGSRSRCGPEGRWDRRGRREHHDRGLGRTQRLGPQPNLRRRYQTLSRCRRGNAGERRRRPWNGWRSRGRGRPRIRRRSRKGRATRPGWRSTGRQLRP